MPNDRSRRDELIGGRNVKIGSREPGFPVFGQNFNLDFDPLPVIFRNEHIRPKILSRRDLSIGVSNSKLLNFSYLKKFQIFEKKKFPPNSIIPISFDAA